MTVLVNGGDIAWKDVSLSVEAGRHVVILKGSGRAADSLALALDGESTDLRANELAASGLLTSVDVSSHVNGLADTIARIMLPER